MNQEPEIGTQLGADGVRNVVATVEQYSAHESRRIQLENHAPIVMLKAEFSLLAEEEQRIQEQLQNAPPPGDLRRHCRKVVFAWLVTVILTVAGFCLAVLTFAPYRLGWQSYVFSIGLSVVVPFLIHELLEYPCWEPAVKTVTAIAAVAGIASLMLLADVRGNLLAQEIQSTPAVIIDDAQPDQTPQNDFYDKTLNPLRLATVLLSLAMELGAGLALRKAWMPSPHNAEDWKRLRGELGAVRRQMVLAAGKITALEDEPAGFEARLWKDFYKSMLTHTVQSAMKKLLVIAIGVAVVPRALSATGVQHTDLVIAIDLSKSVNVKGPDGTTEFQKNVDGVTHTLAQVSTGTHVTVIGITDRSFAQPYILLSATVPDDAGYFGERLDQARQTMIRIWNQRNAGLEPKFSGTDILGAFELTSQILKTRPAFERRVLVIFSDMRNHTSKMNQESSVSLTEAFLHLKEGKYPKPNLNGLQVHALNVYGAELTPDDWHELYAFWNEYLEECGAHLSEFSALSLAKVDSRR